MYEKKTAFRFQNTETSYSAATISPGDGDQIALAVKQNSSFRIDILSADNGKCITTMSGHSAEITCLCYTPDGKYLLSGGKDNVIKYWNLADGEEEYSIEKIIDGAKLTQCFISSIHISPTDSRLFCFTADDLRPSTMVTSTRLDRIKQSNCSLEVFSCSISQCRPFNQRCQFSPNGKWLAAVRDQRVAIFSVRDLECDINDSVWLSEEFEDYTYNLQYSADGKILIAADDSGAFKVWSIEEVDGSVQVEQTYSVGNKETGLNVVSNIRMISTTEELQFLVGCCDSNVAVVARFLSDGKYEAMRGLEGNISNILTIELASSGKRLLTTDSNCFIIWQMCTEMVDKLEDHSARVTAVCFSPDGKELASAAGLPDCSIRVWCLDSGKERLRLNVEEEPKHQVNCLAYHSNSLTLMASYSNGMIRLWNAQNGAGIGIIEYPGSEELSLLPCIFSPSSDYIIASGVDKMIRVWDYETLREVSSVAGHTDQVTSMGFSPDGSLMVSTSNDTTVRLWKRNQLLPPPKTVTKNQKTLQRRFSILKSNQVDSEYPQKTISSKTAVEPYAIYTGHFTATNHAIFSPDGRQLLTSAVRGNIYCWKVEPGQHLRPLAALGDHDNYAYFLFFSNYNLISVSERTVYTWNADYSTWISSFPIEGICQSITAADVHPDVRKGKQSTELGPLLAIGSFDCTVRLSRLDLGSQELHLQGNVKSIAFDLNNPVDSEENVEPNPDWFQRAVEDKIKPISDIYKSVTFLPHDFRVTELPLPQNSNYLGIWVDKSSLKDCDFLDNSHQTNTTFLIETSPRLCSTSIIMYILTNMKKDLRPLFITMIVRECFEEELLKVQKSFDILVREKDDQAIEHMLSEVRKTENIWIPAIDQKKITAKILEIYFEHIDGCMQIHRMAITPAHWKQISQMIPQLMRNNHELAKKFFDAILYYPVPSHVFKDTYLTKTREVGFDIAPAACNWNERSGDFYLRDSSSDIETCLTCYGENTTYEGSMSERTSIWKRIFVDKLFKFFAKSKSVSREKNLKDVVVCYFPLFRFYGKLFQLFSENTSNNELLKMPAVALLVEYKWRLFGKKLYYIWLSAFLILISIFFVLHFNFVGNQSSVGVLAYIGLGGAGIISAAFIFAETLDLVSSGLKSYFSSISNLLDLYSYIVPVLHLTNLIFNLVDIPDIYMSVFMAITTIILFFEALTLMVAAGEIGKFIRMFFEVIKATRFFLLTLLIFLGAFLLAFAAIASYSPSSSAFLNLYLVLVNQNNLDMLKNAGAGTALSNSGTTTLFVIFSFFVMIIMFNLLIALINDIYSDITKDIDAVVVRSKMNMLKKIEKFFFPFSSWYSKKQRETEQKESSNFPDWMVYIVSKEVYVESRK